MVSIRVVESMGPAFAQDWATRFGFEPERHPAFLTLALGVGTVTPLQMATAYAVFANGGYRINPVLVTRLTDSRGRVLVEAKPSELGEDSRSIEPRNAFVMSSLLQEVTRAGTAARAYTALKRPDIYGKTGTTNDANDAWFAGFQPTVVAVCWIGYDQPRKLGDRETGGGLALPLWIDYMGHVLRNVPVMERQVPPGVANVGGEWYYDEYANGGGITAVGLDEPQPAPDAAASAPVEDKRSILDLFRGE
jgi:penicillin-binding protein 1A